MLADQAYIQLRRDIEDLKRKMRKQETKAFLPAPALNTYTPIWTAVSVNPSLGNGTLTGRYVQVGALVTFWIRLVIGSTTTTGTGFWQFTLPVPMKSDINETMGSAMMEDALTADYLGQTVMFSSTDLCRVYFTVVTGADRSANGVQSNQPFTWATADFLTLTGSYIGDV